MKITKEQFVKAMKSIDEQIKIDLKNNEAFSMLLEDDNVTNTKNVLYDSLVDLLKHLTDDNENRWIEHFLYELDFGKENWRLKVYDKDESEIPLATIDDLWAILCDK